MYKLESALTGTKGERVALCDVSVSALLQDLLAEVTVSQTYRNDERVNIEAVYTFPLPLDAVLLDLEVEIGGRRLKGVVVEKKAAEEKYEDAVAAGDAAVMLETIEPGLYTMNVGNLLPLETAKITFSYAILYRWAGDRLRFFLPTTIAPHFGESHHLPHQVPEASLTVENQFSLRIEIHGSLRDAQFICPSHAIELEKAPEKVVLSLLQPKAVMDRDFILNVKAPQATRSFALCGQDGDGLAAVASFQPFFPGLHQPRPLNLAIVIDCSGSMQGDSMEQAKQALEGILDGLQPHDRITLIAFGNSTSALSDRPLACNKTNLTKAKRFAKALGANMGGTEIGMALREAYSIVGEAESADIFLVTDGEVSEWVSVVDEAKVSRNRIFTVGVGSAVSEAFVRQLAAETGGECELVSPREGMAARVVRHFERMRAPRAKRVVVRWPEGAKHIHPSRIGAVFEGDTVVACARFDQLLQHGSAILEVETDKGEVVRQELKFPKATPSSSPGGISMVARVTAAAGLTELDDVAGLDTALRYRLVSRWTNWLVIAPRTEEDKVQDIPALRKVPQTLAAGWGGVGSVAAGFSMDEAALSVSYSRSVDFAGMADLDLTEVESPTRVPPLALPQTNRPLLTPVDAHPSRLDVAGVLDTTATLPTARGFNDTSLAPSRTPAFTRYIGIDYSGAKTPESSLKGLRVYCAVGAAAAQEVVPPPSQRKYWTRRGIAEWLADRLAEDVPTIVGIDHGFSFPLRYFEVHQLEQDWPKFLEDFHRHWPTDAEPTSVDSVRNGLAGNGKARTGNARWRRMTEHCAGSAKSVFHFDVQGSVAKSTHAGIPWLLYLRRQLGSRLHFWPFDGWSVPAGKSAVVEVYPSLWKHAFPADDRTPDQHDAFAVASWLSQADRSGQLERFLQPNLTLPERMVAEVEGWILGVEPPAAGAAHPVSSR